jgi:hypothetical protein
MNKENFYSHNLGKTVERVSKRKAERLFLAGATIYVISCNMKFDNFWQCPCPLQKDSTYTESFSLLVDDYEYYNCDSERGYYAKFYVNA